MSVVLQALLDDGAGFAAEYQGGLSNHLPMALLALRRLGADDQRLSAFFASYSPRLDAAPASVAWPAGDPWRGRFGQVQAWPAYRQLFREWLTHEAGSAVLAQALPPLMAGCGAAAFHGLIRTAYAVQSGHLAEIADALAYWACRHLPIDTSTGTGTSTAAPHARGSTDGSTNLPQTLATLPRVKSKAALIFERMAAVAQHTKFARTAGRLTIDAQTLPALARHAAQAYAASGNFVALHLVTSAHALRVLLPFIDDESDDANSAVRDYWCAYAAAYAAAFPATFTTGVRVSEVAGAASSLLSWPTIVKRAIADNDEHVIKLVDSCREEERAYGGSVWRRAASRVTGVSRTDGLETQALTVRNPRARRCP